MFIKRGKTEIDDVLQKAHEGIEVGSKVPGMSYEEGVVAAIDWMTGFTEDNPMEEDE